MTEPREGEDALLVDPTPGRFELEMHPPGSKSLTNRALLLAALASGRSILHRPLVSDDTVALREALAILGANVTVRDDRWLIDGVDGAFPNGGEVDLGDGGTPARFMLAAAALARAPVRVDGSPRMRERPVSEGIELLRDLGVTITGTGRPEHLPAFVEPWGTRTGGSLSVGRTASSQFLSALLLVAPWTDEGIVLEHLDPPTSASYLELTRGLLRRVGATIDDDGRVRSGGLSGFELPIEPDASSAIYWWSAAALVPEASVTIPVPADSLQPDLHALDLLEAFGARIERWSESVTVHGPHRLVGARIDAERCPDAAVMLSIVAACCEGPSRIDGLRTLRVKETDRIHAVATELAKTGCTVVQHPDALEIDPSSMDERPIRVGTWNDHRMAMAFGVLGLVRPGVTIEDPGCVSKSYPRFWADRADLIDSVEVTRPAPE